MKVALAVDVDPDYIDDEGKWSTGQRALSFSGSRDGLRWLIEFLKEQQVRATLFFEARTARILSGEIDLRSVANTHEIGCHGYEHEDLTKLRANAKSQIIVRTRRINAQLFGVEPVGWSPPYWRSDDETRRILASQGFLYEANAYGKRSIERVNGLVVFRMPKQYALWRVMEGKRRVSEQVEIIEDGAIVATHSWHTEYGQHGLIPESEKIKRRHDLRSFVEAMRELKTQFVTVREMLP